ncbi:MAG: hypothetical protein ACREBG_15665 [Pyrinomonadaceae bacterium]
MKDKLNAAIDELREQLAASIEEIKEDPKMEAILKLHSALNTMEGLIGAPNTSLAAAFALESVTIVQPGEFYGINPLKAAKRYLKKKGKPAGFDEIVAAVRAGGVTVNSLEKLRVSLGRSTLDVAKVGPDHYGLLEFYPHVQRGKKGKPTAEGETPDEGDEGDNGQTVERSDDALPLPLEEDELLSPNE